MGVEPPRREESGRGGEFRAERAGERIRERVEEVDRDRRPYDEESRKA
jgi:hypothetical protein